MSVAAAKDFEVLQVDIKTAFLNSDLEEEVFVTQPTGFENGDPRVVCKLNKALLGFEACKSDAGVYVRKREGEESMYILVYVDDLLIICKDLNRVEWFKQLLRAKFNIHDLGEVKDFMGCQVRRNRENKQLSISCIPKIDALLEKFSVSEGGRVVDTPMQKDFCPTQLSSVEERVEE